MAQCISESFCTDLVPNADRLDAWLLKARQICGDCRFEFPPTRVFYGRIERRTVGAIDLTCFSSAPLSFRKFPAIAAGSPDRSFVVITQLQGVRTYHQGNAVVVLRPGDTTLVDSGRPWSSDCAGECSRLYMRVPVGLMQSRLGLNTPLLPRIAGGRGTGATLSNLMMSLYRNAEIMLEDEGACANEAYLDLLTACLQPRGSVAGVFPWIGALGSRIERFIELNLGDAALSPPMVAEAVGISVRHLHRVFSARGRTPGEWIRQRRLDRCRCDMADRRLCGSSITEIAFSWGFSDSAHFSRCFRQRFGMSPREFRAQVNPRIAPEFARGVAPGSSSRVN